MLRPLRLAPLVLLALAACELEEVHVLPSAVSAFEGVRTAVYVHAELGCDDPALPVVEDASDGPTAWFDAEAQAVGDRGGGDYFIGNPGKNRDIYLPDDPAPPTHDESTGKWVCIGDCASGTKDFIVLVAPRPGAGQGERRLRVVVRGCGTEASDDLTVTVLGPLDLGGFCGFISGTPCEADAGCARAAGGDLCVGTDEGGDPTAWSPSPYGWPYAPGDCSDPVPSGATCGCVMGACAWRPP